MVMFLNVGLVRSMSVFIHDSNFQTWKEKHLCCALRSGSGADEAKENQEQD